MRFGLALSAALLGLGTVTGAAVADPEQPPTTDTTATGTPAEPTPTEPAPAEPTSSEPTSGDPAPPGEPGGSQPGPSEPDPTTTAPTTTREATAQVESLDVTASFDKPSYRTGETMTIHVAVTNPHAERAEHIQVSHNLVDADRIEVDWESWGPFTSGATIEPGATVAVDVTGQVANPDVTTGVFDGFLFDETGFGIASFRFTTPVTPTFAHLRGIVYADANDNARYDQGEGLEGAVVRTSNVVYPDWEAAEATTDASGAFDFPHLPTVRMIVSATAPDGWLVGYSFVTLDEDGLDDLRLRAGRPLTNLKPGLAFTKDSYQPGEVAKVKVTLTNTGSHPYTGIVANCNRVGAPNALEGTGPGWGDLAPEANGVTVPAHSSRTFVVTEAVPQAAFESGLVYVACDFSYSGVDDLANPEAFDTAKVPGGFGDLVGEVHSYPDGYDHPAVGLGDVRLVLVTDDRCPIVAQRRTDADGRFEFRHVPAGDYELYVFTPVGWRVVEGNPTQESVHTNFTPDRGIEVTPGSAAAPTLPKQPASCTASTEPGAAQGRPGPATGSGTGSDDLAHTGANVLGLAALGAGVLVAGAGVVLTTRRRRSRA